MHIAAEKVPISLGRCSKQLERPSLQRSEAGQPLFGRIAAAHPARETRALFDCRWNVVVLCRHGSSP